MKKENYETLFDPEQCPVRTILDRFSDKWSLLVLFILHRKGVQRFNEIFHLMGDISQKVLASTLRTLEANGLVSRKVYAEVPPRVEYQLTELGQSLMPYVLQLRQWAIDNAPAILRKRKRYETS